MQPQSVGTIMSNDYNTLFVLTVFNFINEGVADSDIIEALLPVNKQRSNKMTHRNILKS